jgi:hypothetical protein
MFIVHFFYCSVAHVCVPGAEKLPLAACQKWQDFIFGYFSMKLGRSVDGHEKIII